jgi:hypothetical protein
VKGSAGVGGLTSRGDVGVACMYEGPGVGSSVAGISGVEREVIFTEAVGDFPPIV